MTGWVLTVLGPSAAWVLAHLLARRTPVRLPFLAHPVVGFLVPPALLRWCGRSFPEQAVAWVVSVLTWGGVFMIHDLQVFAAFGLIGAVWGFVLGLTALKPAQPTAQPRPQPVPVAPAAERPADGREAGFALELRCPTCGAAVSVPLYHLMVRCEFCGSEHVVTGRSGTLVVVVPDAVTSEAAVKTVVLKYLRHLHYLELYERRVRPLLPGSGFEADQRSGEAAMLAPERTPALLNALEAEVAHAADAYATGIAPRLELRSWQRFLSPYWHRMGTLYQAGFGRDAEGVKRMEFAVTTIEGSLSATQAPLPAMGKLSYLRTLRPLLGSPEASIPALPVELGEEEIGNRVQQTGRRSTELPVTPIAFHTTLVPEIVALVYRPWHLATLELDGKSLDLLLDGGASVVEGETPVLEHAPTPLADLEGEPPTLAPSRCPECGGDLTFAPDAVAHLCRTCYRMVVLRGSHWTVIPYAHEEPAAGRWLVPFWSFPLRFRTATGGLIVDLAHLTDGVDGTYDQIGDRPQRQQQVFVPAFRTRVGRSGVRLYRQLWPLAQQPHRGLQSERFTRARPPERVVEVTLPPGEARIFALVYLAIAFTQRDLARAQVKTVRERFLAGKLEGEPELVFLCVPDELIAPFQGLFGRAPLAAVAELEGRPPAPGG
jgi:DNA-directed RNA polymerase subunit RPC12/RpoP